MNKIIKNKTGTERWLLPLVVCLILLAVILLAVIKPTREFLAQVPSKIVDLFRFT